VLETLLEDVLVDELGHLRSRNEFLSWKGEERAQLRRDFLLSVKPVVLGTLLSLLTIGILLGILDLTNKLGEGLYLGTKSNDIGLDGFKRHYIYLTDLIFKSWNTRNNNVIIIKKPNR